MEVEKFLTYILEKYFVFHPLADLDESNTIDDIEIVKREIDIKKYKNKDVDMINFLKQIIEKFRCYNISTFDPKGNTFGERLSLCDAENVYSSYKRYKCNSYKKEDDCCKSKLELDTNVDTKDTFYVGSLDTITTRDLKSVFGEYICTGNESDNYRYEYKFVFGKNRFSLYDYKDENGRFYDEKEIYWHVASDTDKMNIYNNFKTELLNVLNVKN